ncbi:hypothetical protein Godav_023241 [Gossypium davidsonii]|uniref:Uncharacterized protein n=1 Tax=Gossypium davidsonii TaxID=34287 RepID=A0A7J8SRI2_GOSDV|nr:hypothetical protein [Gossypium davidsonii]
MEEGEEGTKKRKLKGIFETEEVGESEEERNIKIETISKGGGANQKQWTEEDTFLTFFRRKRWIQAKSTKQKSYE